MTYTLNEDETQFLPQELLSDFLLSTVELVLQDMSRKST